MRLNEGAGCGSTMYEVTRQTINVQRQTARTRRGMGDYIWFNQPRAYLYRSRRSRAPTAGNEMFVSCLLGALTLCVDRQQLSLQVS